MGAAKYVGSANRSGYYMHWSLETTKHQPLGNMGHLEFFISRNLHFYQRGCVTAVQCILFKFANYSPSIAMELKVSKEITCK